MNRTGEGRLGFTRVRGCVRVCLREAVDEYVGFHAVRVA